LGLPWLSSYGKDQCREIAGIEPNKKESISCSEGFSSGEGKGTVQEENREGYGS